MEWFGRMRECGFRVKVASQSSFGLTFPIQGIVADCDVHHLPKGFRFSENRDFLLESLWQAIIELES